MRKETIVIHYMVDDKADEVVASGYKATGDIDETMAMLIQTYITMATEHDLSPAIVKHDLDMATQVFLINTKEADK